MRRFFSLVQGSVWLSLLLLGATGSCAIASKTHPPKRGDYRSAVDEALLKANSAIGLKQFSAATDILSSAIARYPAEARLYEARAEARLQARAEINDAIEDAKLAIAYGELTDSKCQRAKKFVLLARLHGRKKQWGRFVDYLNTALKIDGSCVEAHNHRALLFYHNKKYASAVKDWNEVLKHGESVRAYCLRGDCYRNMHMNDKARSDLEKAVQIGPDDFAPYLFRGLFFYHLADNKKAIEDFTKAIKLNPTGYEAYYWRSVSYDELGNEGLARKDKEMARIMVRRRGERLLNFTVPGLN